MLAHQLALVAAESKSQRTRRLVGDRILHCKNISELRVKLFSPQRSAIRDSQELNSHSDTIVSMLNVAVERCLHAEFTTGSQWIFVDTTVSQHGTGWPNRYPATVAQ